MVWTGDRSMEVIILTDLKDGWCPVNPCVIKAEKVTDARAHNYARIITHSVGHNTLLGMRRGEGGGGKLLDLRAYLDR